jgi:dolichol-phosphate mannosyltransferase
MVRYSIIIPVYNEEEVIVHTYQRLNHVMKTINEPYELIFVNDGSRDKTYEKLEQLEATDSAVRVLDFSRNFGHQIAITAGMDHSQGQAIVVIDADLQDPPELIIDMIAKWKEGYDVVYAKRVSRKGETWFKKASASLFYRILHRLSDVDIPIDTGDFRLIDRQVADQLKEIREKNRFVRGLVSWVGFRQTAVEYERDERQYGETKYPLKRMIKLSVDGMTSFSIKPLKITSYLGVFSSVAGFLYMIYVLYLRVFTDDTITGWASAIIIQLFFSGITLIMLGIIGEYVGRIYDESKNRPIYILREKRKRE